MYVASTITSLNHKIIEYITKNKDIKNKIYICSKLCIVNAPETVNENKLVLVKIGQGEGDTI
jgi:hypothetical protein